MGPLRKVRVAVVGAGGRDFHNFMVALRRDAGVHVVAFLFTQVPGVEFRRVPASVAGEGYPAGIPVYPLDELPKVVKFYGVDEVVVALSDLTYGELGNLISYILSTGCNLRLLGLRETMLDSVKPVLAVTATKTGSGKSTVSRALVRELRGRGLRVAVVRHPMVYGDIGGSLVQVFREPEDLERYRLTVEEREEVEPHLESGATVLMGVDYAKVLEEAEALGDAVLWDGGNNDWPFFRPWYWVTVTDATRPGMEVGAYPGEVNVRLADAVVVTKVGEAPREQVEEVVRRVRSINRLARIVKADFVVQVDRPGLIEGRRVVVVEDAPTVTHGGAPHGAGYVAARRCGAVVVDPRPYAVGEVRRAYELYPHMGPVVPSLGYTPQQLRDLEETLNRADADAIIMATPAKLEGLLKLNKPVARAHWRMEVVEGPTLKELVDEFLSRRGPKDVP